MAMWVLCFVAWLLKRAWEELSGESMVMWGGAQRGTTAACFPYYYSNRADDLTKEGMRQGIVDSGAVR